MKPIIMASDHGGYELKQQIKTHLMYKDYPVIDVGTDSIESVDYPVFVNKAVELVKKHNTYGIFLCGAGIGASIAANRHKGIRAGLVQSGQHGDDLARLAREHNNANVLCLGGRFMTELEAIDIVETFLKTEFMGKQHIKRVKMLDN